MCVKFKILTDRGYQYSKLVTIIKKCLRKYNLVFRKFGIVDDETIILSLPNG